MLRRNKVVNYNPLRRCGLMSRCDLLVRCNRLVLCGLLALCGLLVFSGCGAKNQEKSPSGTAEIEQKEDAPLIDEAYLLSNTSLTKQDLVGIDSADFIATWNLTAESLQKLDVSACLYAYKQANGLEPQGPETAALLDSPLMALPQDNMGAITTLVLRVEDASETLIMFDFAQQKLYSTKGIQLVERRGLTDADQTSLYDWIAQEDVAGWQTEYLGSQVGEWPYRWDLVIALDDGSIAHYRGDQAAPEGMRALPDAWCNWLINEEYLLQNTTLQPSDLSGVSVAEFVSAQGLTLAMVDSNSETMRDLLAKYKASS